MTTRPRKPPEDTATDLADGMQRAVQASGVSLRRLEQQAGVTPDAIRNIIRGLSHDPRGTVTEKIAAYLGVEAAALRGQAPWPETVQARTQGVGLDDEVLRRFASMARFTIQSAREAARRATEAADAVEIVALEAEAMLRGERAPSATKKAPATKKWRRS